MKSSNIEMNQKSDAEKEERSHPIVLHVDDDADYLQLFSMSFGKHFKVFSADRAEEALEMLEQEKIDILVTDYDMPEINGIDLLKIVRERHPDIPVIFQTGQGNENIAREAFTIGAVDYFTKDYIGFAFREKVLNSIHKAFLIKRAHEEKKESQRKYRDLLESLLDLVFTTNEEGIITFANLSFERILGRKSESFVGTSLIEHIVPEDRKHFTESLSRRLKTSESFITFKVRIKSDHQGIRHIKFNCTPIWDEDRKFRGLTGTGRDITRQVKAEKEKALTAMILESLNGSLSPHQAINDILHLIKEATEIEAVGIRLKEGEDYPYYVTNGFPGHFVEKEMYLCGSDDKGEILRNENGSPVLDCMCGNIIQGRTNPEFPFFTPGGSFWSNCTTNLIKEFNESDRAGSLRNHCNEEGYESIALIPLKCGNEMVGLLQLNDRREDRFTLEMIEFFEGIGASIGIAMHRIRMQRALEESESRFRTFFENSPAGMVIFSNEDIPRCQAISKSLAELNCFSVKDHLGKTINEIFDNEKIGTNYNNFIMEILENKMPSTIESSAQTRDGILRHYMAHFFPIVDSENKVVSAGGVIINLTEKIEAEIKLKESENKYRNLVELLPQTVFETDLEGNFTYLNQYGLKMFGYTKEDFEKGLSISDLLFPADFETAQDNVSKIVTDNKDPGNEYAVIGKDGAEINVMSYSSPLYEGNVQAGWIGTSIDITKLKNTEKNLTAEREKFYRVLEAIPAFVYLQSADYTVKYANRKFRELFGEFEGRYCYQVMEGAEKICDICPTFEVFGDKITRQWEWKNEKSNQTFLITDTYLEDTDGTPLVLEFGLDMTERIELEQKYRNITENSLQGIGIIQEGRLVFANKALLEMGGYLMSDLVSPAENNSIPPNLAIIHPEDLPLVMNKMESRFKGESESERIHFRIFAKNGEFLWVETLARVIEFNGKPAIQFVMIDITAQKNAEEILRKSEEKFRKFFELGLVGMSMSTTTGKLTEINDQLCEMLGYSRQEMIGRSFTEFTHSEDLEENLEVYKELMDGKIDRLLIEKKYIKKDGLPVTCLVAVSCSRNDMEKVDGAYAIIVDISALKEANNALKKSREQYRMLTENVSETIYYLDNNGMLIYVSPRVEIFGYKPDETVGRHFSEFIYDEDRELIGEYFNRVIMGTNEPSPLFRLKGTEDNFFWVENLTNCIKDTNGEIIGLTGILKDVSDLIRQQNHIEHLNRVLKATRKINQLIVKEFNPEKLIERACQILTETRGYEAAGIILLDENGKPEMAKDSGYEGKFGRFFDKYRQGEFPHCIDKVLKENIKYFCRDTTNISCDLRLFRLENICMVNPLDFEETTLGLIFVSIPGNMDIDEEELNLFKELCTDISYGLHHIKVRENRQQILEALKHKNQAEENIRIAGIFIMVLDVNGKIAMINRKGSEILGVDENQLIGLDWIDNFIPHYNREKIRGFSISIVKGEKGNDIHFEDTIVNSKDEERVVSWHITRMKDKSGNHIGMLCTGDDITERKRLEEKLRSSLREKEILLMEINHRTKNNLQILSSLVNHQILKADNANTKELLGQIKGRLKAMAVIYEALCRQEDISKVNFQDFLEKFFQDFLASYKLEKSSIRTEIEAEGIYLDIKKGVACALIINELASNSLKHAFPNEKQGIIKIKIYIDRDNYIISISDNGIGMPDKLDLKRTESLGLKIVHLLTMQLKGEIKKRNVKGTEWIISFPV